MRLRAEASTPAEVQEYFDAMFAENRKLSVLKINTDRPVISCGAPYKAIRLTHALCTWAGVCVPGRRCFGAPPTRRPGRSTPGSWRA